MLNRNDRVMHWTAAKACLIKRGPCIFCFFYSRISHFQLISQLSCKMWHLTQRQSTKRTKANKTGCSDNKTYTKEMWMKQGENEATWNEMHFQITLKMSRSCRDWKTVHGKYYRDEQTMARLKMVSTKWAQTQKRGACCWWSGRADRARIAPWVRVSRAPHWVQLHG